MLHHFTFDITGTFIIYTKRKKKKFKFYLSTVNPVMNIIYYFFQVKSSKNKNK